LQGRVPLTSPSSVVVWLLATDFAGARATHLTEHQGVDETQPYLRSKNLTDLELALTAPSSHLKRSKRRRKIPQVLIRQK